MKLHTEPEKPRRQRRKVGRVVLIELGNALHGYARTKDEASFSIYDVCTGGHLNMKELAGIPILFEVAVMKFAVTQGRWKNVGDIPGTEADNRPQPKFMQDVLNLRHFQIYEDGKIREASRAECEGLERAAVWFPEHVEDRIRDHYAGRPNKWLESMRIREH